jgi:diketogulonate reductase-like aldo/keto reductase
VDLLLLHWPIVGKDREAWKALEQLYHDGKARSIGVSNYLPHHLDALLQSGVAVRPMVNHIEFHPYLLQPVLAATCRKQGIVRAAWSPLMQGKITEVPEIAEIARSTGKPCADCPALGSPAPSRDPSSLEQSPAYRGKRRAVRF